MNNFWGDNCRLFVPEYYLEARVSNIKTNEIKLIKKNNKNKIIILALKETISIIEKSLKKTDKKYPELFS